MANLLQVMLLMFATASQTLASSHITYYDTDPECIPVREYNDNILEGVRTLAIDVKEDIKTSANSTSEIVLERIQALADEIRPKLDISAKQTDVETLLHILVQLKNQSSGTLGDLIPCASIMNNYTQLIDDKINSLVKQQQDEFKRMERFMLSVTNSLSQISTSISTLSTNNPITEGTVLPTTQPPTTEIPPTQTATTLASDPSTTVTPSGTVLPPTQPPTTEMPPTQTTTTLASDPSTTVTPSGTPTPGVPKSSTPAPCVPKPSLPWFAVGGDRFVRFTEGMSWDLARLHCQSNCLDLFVPNNAIEVATYLKNNFSSTYWLGARGNGSHQVWEPTGDAVPRSDPWYSNGYNRVDTDRCVRLMARGGYPGAGTVLQAAPCTYEIYVLCG